MSDASDWPLAMRRLLVHGLSNKLVARYIVVLKPHCDWRLRSKAIQKEETYHPVHLVWIKWLEVCLLGTSKTGALGCSSCIGSVHYAPLDKLLWDLHVKEVLWMAVMDFVGQEVPCGHRHTASIWCWKVGVLWRKFRPTHLLLFPAAILMPWGAYYDLYVRWTKESNLRATKHVNTVNLGSRIWIQNNPPWEG